MASVSLVSGDLEVVIRPDLGGRISEVKFRGVELLLQEVPDATHDPVFAGSYVMAPFAGRIRDGKFSFSGNEYEVALCTGHDHAMHGYALDRPWRVLSQTPTSCTLQITLDERWPFGGTVEQTIELHENKIEQMLRFIADQPSPVWLGWHPWWKRELANGSSAQLHFTAKQMLEREGALPTGKFVEPKSQPWDDAFTDLESNPRIVWSNFAELEMTSSHSWWVVYNERDDAICVEPQSAPPNAIELELAPVVAAGSTHEISSSWIFSAL